MTTTPPEDWTTANPFALAAISQASEHAAIIASRDIFDDRGVKLWAANLRVSPTLHQRLIARKLQHPLETSLRVEDGVDNDALVAEVERFLAGDEFLARFVSPVADAVRDGARRVYLAPAAQLLLTASQQNDPEAYRHAARGLALAGALALRTKAPSAMVDHAFAAGLLHDIGEMYVNPAYQRGGRLLEPPEFRHVASHPLIGSLLLHRLADYPEAVCRAVREHHEKLDGTGYPAQLAQNAISPLGQLLAMAEMMLGLSGRGRGAAAAMSFALRFVPGEMNAAWSGPVVRVADAETGPANIEDGTAPASPGALRRAHEAVGDLLAASRDLAGAASNDARRVALRAAHRLERLRLAGDAMGLWQINLDAAATPRERIDCALALREVRHRLNSLPRDCLWPETDPMLLNEPSLSGLWLRLQGHLLELTP